MVTSRGSPNTLLRVAVDLLLARESELTGVTEAGGGAGARAGAGSAVLGAR